MRHIANSSKHRVDRTRLSKVSGSKSNHAHTCTELQGVQGMHMQHTHAHTHTHTHTHTHHLTYVASHTHVQITL